MKKTVLYVGGLGRSLEELTLGIESSQDKYRIVEKQFGEDVVYEIEDKARGRRFQLEIREVVWQDIIEESRKKKKSFLGKSLLFLYWFKIIFILKCLSSKNRAIILNLLIGGVCLAVWYSSAAIIAIQGIVKIIGDSGNDLVLRNLQWLTETMKGIYESDFMSSPIWVFIFLSVNLLNKRVDEMVELLDKVKVSLSEGRVRCLFRRRFLRCIYELDEKMDGLTIVSHSFGTILTLDYLINVDTLSKKKFKFISLGSPINFLSLRSKRIKEELDKFIMLLAREEPRQEWRFIYSNSDWMSPDIPEENMSESMDNILAERFTSLDIGGEETFLEKLSKNPHMKYFYDKRVIEEIVLGGGREGRRIRGEDEVAGSHYE